MCRQSDGHAEDDRDASARVHEPERVPHRRGQLGSLCRLRMVPVFGGSRHHGSWAGAQGEHVSPGLKRHMGDTVCVSLGVGRTAGKAQKRISDMTNDEVREG